MYNAYLHVYNSIQFECMSTDNIQQSAMIPSTSSYLDQHPSKQSNKPPMPPSTSMSLGSLSSLTNSKPQLHAPIMPPLQAPIQPLHQSNQPLQPPHPVQNTRHQFQDLLTCHICFCHVNSPMMCPYCSKLYCQPCIRKCLQFKPQCPNCRKQIKNVGMMASCNRFVNQLVSIVNQLIQQKSQEQICQEHEVAINYYCEECCVPVCCQCQMFGKHQKHSLKRLNIIYQARYDALRQTLSQFKTRLKSQQLTLKQVQQQLQQLKKLKQKNLKQLQQYTEHYRLKIIQQTTRQTTEIQQNINKYNQILVGLNKLEEQLNVKAEEAERNGTFVIEEDFVKKIEAGVKGVEGRVEGKQKSVLEEVIPGFYEWRFVISNFNKKKKDRSTIFSPTQKCQGTEWRLKIYPNGNTSFQGNFLSIFIEMVSTIHSPTLYQYQIQLINRTNPHQTMLRESSSTFEPGQSWGYNKYIKLQNLLRDGFVDPVTDQLEIRYYIRNPYYFSIYKQKEVYLQYLDNEISGQEVEIRELEALLGTNAEL